MRDGFAAVKDVPRRLFEPLDNASLVLFRIAFGAVMLWETYRYFSKGWIPRYWIQPDWHFTYHGFGWVTPWPGAGMYLHWFVLGFLALLIMTGLLYRVAAALFFVGFSYVFLLDQATYLNHFYLVILMSFALIFVPANRALSLDTWVDPRRRSDTAPAWALYLIRTQIGLVYIYSGIAKLNADWLFRAEPLSTWLGERDDTPLIGSLFAQAWTGYVFSYGGLFLDLFAVPLLIWKRSRPYMFALLVGFHLMNAVLFQIGIFPWFSIVATSMFLEPDWPRRLGRWIRGRLPEGLATRLPSWAAGGSEASTASKVPGAPQTTTAAKASGTPQVSTTPPQSASTPARGQPPTRLRTAQRVTVVLLAIYVGAQVLFPLRSELYPGDVHWTEEGHRFSWRQKLRDKDVETARFLATDPRSGRTWIVEPGRYLTERQVTKFPGRPDMVVQFARHVRERYAEQGMPGIEVRALVWVSLNGRPPRLLLDPRVDLASKQRSVWHVDWILPYDQAARAPTGPLGGS